MTVTSGFFNSISEDRKYDAEQISGVFESIIQDGVNLGVGANFTVQSTGGLNITIGAGRCWFNQRWMYNSAAEPRTLEGAEPSQARIDAVVIEVDLSVTGRAVTFKIVKGTPAGSSPARPNMVRTETIKQYAIAYINRSGGSTSITSESITNVVGTVETPYAVSRLFEKTVDPSSFISSGTTVPANTVGKDGDLFFRIL